MLLGRGENMTSSTSSSTSSKFFSTSAPWFAVIGIITFLSAFILIFVSYVSPNWIEVDANRDPKGTTFRKLGLWMTCHSNLHDPYYYDPYLTSGREGCRWIYYPVVSSFTDLRDFLLPSFIATVQITYSLCFGTTLTTFVMTVVYLIKYRMQGLQALRYLLGLGITLQGAGLLGDISVIVFGTLSTSRTWAVEWQFHNLSWAFHIAIGSVISLHLAGLFLLIEAGRQIRRRRNQGSYPVIATLVKPSTPSPVRDVQNPESATSCSSPSDSDDDSSFDDNDETPLGPNDPLSKIPEEELQDSPSSPLLSPTESGNSHGINDKEYFLPNSEEYFSTRESWMKYYEETTTTHSMPSDHYRPQSGNNPAPPQGTKSFMDLMKQPVALRIHVQKHQNESSTKPPVSNHGDNFFVFSESSV